MMQQGFQKGNNILKEVLNRGLLLEIKAYVIESSVSDRGLRENKASSNNVQSIIADNHFEILDGRCA